MELEVLVCDSLDVEADGGDGLHELVLLQLEQDGRLAGAVQTQGNDSHLDLGADVDPVILEINSLEE